MRAAARLAAAFWLAAAPAAAEIAAADYAEPTRAYPHGVLGDDEEWGALTITVRDAGQGAGLRTYRIAAPPDTVFEDTAPRLWDITGDGAPEVVAVLSHQALGARLVVFAAGAGAAPRILATTPPIGTRFRWLAPVGAADLDGDGHVEIAYVDRPHLARTLRVWRYTPESFAEIATLAGVTNHQIGDRAIRGGLRDCGTGPELVLADAGWSRAVSVRLVQGRLTPTPLGPLDSRESLDAALACP